MGLSQKETIDRVELLMKELHVVPEDRDGIRDRTLCHVGVTGGLRVSEIIGLCLDDLTFRGRYVDVFVRGKGRKGPRSNKSRVFSTKAAF